MTAICQKSLADAPWVNDRTRRLPGVQPLDPNDWIVVDDAYGAQMQERACVLANNRPDVLQTLPVADDAIAELLEEVMAHLAARNDFGFTGSVCMRPDGIEIDLSELAPFDQLCHLVTEDFCIMQKVGDEHVLSAALLCFPASWTLAEKFGQPLMQIHDPVEEYDSSIAKRVQRLFDAVQVGRPLWRANALRYVDPTLFQPRPADARRNRSDPGKYVRTERQCIVRLPKTDAVVFSIQTRQVHIDDLTVDQRRALETHNVDTEARAE